MYYDIRSIGPEYLTAEKLRKSGDIDSALEHYKLALAHYENADNEYLLDPDSPYDDIICGETISYPSVHEMIRVCYKKINKQDEKSNRFAGIRFLTSIKELIKKILSFK